MPLPASRTLQAFAVSIMVAALLVPAASSSADDLCRVKDGSTTYGNVQDAVNTAAPGGKLVIHGTCEGSITIDRDLLLVGAPGAYLGGWVGSTPSILTITSGHAVTIRGLFLEFPGSVYNAGTLMLRRDVGSVRTSATGPNSSKLIVVECYFIASRLSAHTIRVVRSTFQGGGPWVIASDESEGASMTILASTITGVGPPGADYDSGAILAGPRLQVIGSTIAGNVDIEGNSPGIENDDPSFHVTVSSSILYNNDPVDCAGIVHSGGYNIIGNLGNGWCQFQAQPTDRIGVNPRLTPLSDNGGFSPTLQLRSGSPAIDAIPVGAVGANGVMQLCRASGSTDERGVARPQGQGCDIGAVESRWGLA